MVWRSQQRLEDYERKAEPVMLVAALLFCVAFAWPIIKVDLGEPWYGLCVSAQAIIWLVFLADYIFRLLIAPQRWTFVKSNIVDIVIIVLPMFRPLRLLRLLYLLRFLDRKAGDSLKGKVAWYTAGSAFLVVFIGALAELDAEQSHPQAIISNFGTALWWAVTTVTTVGYGDTYPVTLEGRIVATVLMLYGIGLLGTVTGMLASWLVERVDEADAARDAVRDQQRDEVTSQEIRELRSEITQLKTEIRELTQLSRKNFGD